MPQQPPKPHLPMTTEIMQSYLEDRACRGKTILVNGSPVVNARVVGDHILLMTDLDMFNENPPCEKHFPHQHRDYMEPWCNNCGLTANWKKPLPR